MPKRAREFDALKAGTGIKDACKAAVDEDDALSNEIVEWGHAIKRRKAQLLYFGTTPGFLRVAKL